MSLTMTRHEALVHLAALMIFYGSIISGSLAIHRIGVQLQGVSALVLLLPLSGVWPTTGSATRSPNER